MVCLEYLRTCSSYLGKFALKVFFRFVKAILVKWNRVVQDLGTPLGKKKRGGGGSLQPKRRALGSKYILVCAALFLVLLGFIFFSWCFCFLRIPLCPTLSNPGEQGEPRGLKCVHNNQ